MAVPGADTQEYTGQSKGAGTTLAVILRFGVQQAPLSGNTDTRYPRILDAKLQDLRETVHLNNSMHSRLNNIFGDRFLNR
jgi:hypothetical protein